MKFLTKNTEYSRKKMLQNKLGRKSMEIKSRVMMRNRNHQVNFKVRGITIMIHCLMMTRTMMMTPVNHHLKLLNKRSKV